tara:strand:+ start:3019 stop:3384 length:366 start_codon:yes stop_codon:yes gene_type:complete
MNEKEDDNVDNDFEYARQTYHDILAKGSAALDDMMDVARATEHPRAFEVLSGMMKTLADVNGNLLDLHKKKKDIHKNETTAPALTGGTTNNLFVGSTTDLQRFLIDQQKSDVIDVIPINKE